MNKTEALAAAQQYNAHLAPKLDALLADMTVAQLKEAVKSCGRRAPSGPKVRADYVQTLHQALTSACYNISGYTALSGYVVGQLPKTPVLRSVLGI